MKAQLIVETIKSSISLDDARLFISDALKKRSGFIAENGKEPQRIILGPMQMLKLLVYKEMSLSYDYICTNNIDLNKLFGMEIIQMNVDGIAFDIGDDFMKFINIKQTRK